MIVSVMFEAWRVYRRHFLLICDVITAFGSVGFACAYRQIVTEHPNLTISARDIIGGPTGPALPNPQ